jgi:lysophospholipase
MKLRLILGVLALCLSACERGAGEAFVAPRLAPAAPTRAWPPQGWAWGLIRIADRPPQRYGVSAPANAPIGDIVILPSYGESAEWWFETVRDLNREGYTVWILDGDGQGGSGRYTPQRDLGHTADFHRDVEGLRVLLRRVIRPAPDRPVILIASGTAALTALSAAEQGVSFERLILSAPKELSVASGGLPATAAKLGLATLRASGGSPWRRDAVARSAREKTALGWAIANPDLRMGGPSTGWLRARRAFRAETTRPEALARITAPVTLIAAEVSGALSCDHIARCMVRPLPARLPYHVEDDPVRSAWIGALIGELGTEPSG